MNVATCFTLSCLLSTSLLVNVSFVAARSVQIAHIAKDESGVDDICTLPPEISLVQCLAAIPRYYHNATAASCQSYDYGGCGGTKNLFVTLNECQLACERNATIKN